MTDKEELIKLFSMDLRRILKKVPVDFERVQEIRLRVEQPLLMVYEGREFFITEEGSLTNSQEEAWNVSS